MIEGGLPAGSVTIVSGPPGVGKSTFAMQYLINGIEEHGENGVYITVEEKKEDVEKYSEGFGWKIREYEKEGKLAIVTKRIHGTITGEEQDNLGKVVEEMKAKRIALDSVTLFKYMYRDETSRRVNLLNFMNDVKDHGCTSLLIAEQNNPRHRLEYSDEHFLSDGLFMLFWSAHKEKQERCFQVVKLRGSKINPDVRPMDITEDGVIVYPNQVPLSLSDE